MKEVRKISLRINIASRPLTKRIKAAINRATRIDRIGVIIARKAVDG
jgi:hypothetical protein